jgi:hypothetical protein
MKYNSSTEPVKQSYLTCLAGISSISYLSTWFDDLGVAKK